MKGFLTTRQQDAWRELINKEAFCRVTWKAKYGHKYPSRGIDHGVSKKKIFLPAICPPQEGPGSPRGQNRAVQKEEEGQHLLGEKEAQRCGEEDLCEMRPPTPQTMQLLYQGFSQEGKGRFHYLKERQLKSPEEKFCYPVLSSWEYGWRLDETHALEELLVHSILKSDGDVVKELKTPIHGKSRIVKDTFYFKNGIFYHPSKTDKLT